MAKRIYTSVFSRNAVLEVREGNKVKVNGEWKEIYGRAILRAANLQSGENHQEVIVSLTPTECYKVALAMKQVAKNNEATKKKVLVHKPVQDEEKFTELIVEQWRNNNRTGFAVLLQTRNQQEIEKKVNVAMDKVEFLALADFLQSLNSLLRWKEIIKIETQQEEIPVDDPILDEEEELPDNIF